jgi:hypothetical protein
MESQTQERMKAKMNYEKWLNRYYITLKAEEYAGYKDVIFCLCRIDMSEELIANLVKPLGIDLKSEENIYIPSQVEETFTLKQVTKLIDYFSTWDRTSIIVRLADKPSPGVIGVKAIPVGGLQDFYMFSTAEGYQLDFMVWGYCDLRKWEEIE